MTPITISVTAAHIAKGELKCTRCPVALAILDSGMSYASADPDDLIWTDAEGFSHQVACPANAQDFINAYDNGEPVTPFTFELRDESV